MKRLILIFFAAIGFGVTFLVGGAIVLSLLFFSEPGLPDRIVLEVDLSSGLVETSPEDPLLLALEESSLRTRDLVLAIEAAADDPRVEALLLRGAGSLPGWATAEEIRDAVNHFGASGKPTVFFTETFGELTPGQLTYYLATAFGTIYLQPSGEVGLAPLLMESLFFRGLLDRWEIAPRFDRRAEYKDASEIFTESEFTPDAEEARRAVLQALEESLVNGIAQGRNLPPERARELLYGGPYPAREALESGLVDGLRYLDEVHDEIYGEGGGSPVRVGPSTYLAGRESRAGGETRVALVYGIGTIQRGEGGYDFLTGGSAFGSASVAKALRTAADDPQVRAILFRVDSPGGSWPASDQVRREVRRARDRGIPVVVSMGNLAASGGYVVAMDADVIVAHPSTITGSIGVVGGRLILDEFLASLGITSDEILVDGGENFYAALRDYSPRDWERFQLFLDRIYGDFVQGVADGRGMTSEEVEAVARGRVWSGRDAAELGLVDRLGGFPVALDAIREELDLVDGAPVQLIVYPAERTLLELLIERANSGGGAGVLREAPELGASALLRGLLSVLERESMGIPAGAVQSPSWEVPGR